LKSKIVAKVLYIQENRGGCGSPLLVQNKYAYVTYFYHVTVRYAESLPALLLRKMSKSVGRVARLSCPLGPKASQTV
jgi:hypothetical protein